MSVNQPPNLFDVSGQLKEKSAPGNDVPRTWMDESRLITLSTQFVSKCSVIQGSLFEIDSIRG